MTLIRHRSVRTVGELVQNQFRIGMSRMERVVRERMASQDAGRHHPQSLINIRPIVAAINEFGSSQLQFMDQANPAAGLTHKRRLFCFGTWWSCGTSPVPAVVPTFLRQSATFTTRTTPVCNQSRLLRDQTLVLSALWHCTLT